LLTQVTLPLPTQMQQRVIDNPAKRKVVCTGRRSGKTTMGAIVACCALLKRQNVLIASTSQDQSDIFWRYVTRWLAPLVSQGLIKQNKTKRTMEFGLSLLRVRTGSDADILRGFDCDILILDECAYLDPAAWYEVGAPMMADRDGTTYFYSTPARKNWFYILYQRAVADATGRWAAFHATTHDNPHLSASAVADLAGDMTADAYQQEIMAQFLEGAGQVFRNVEECATAVRCFPYPGRFIMGVDTAQQTDYSVFTVLDANTRRMVDFDRFHRVAWSVYRDRVAAMRERWNCHSIIFETNSIGGPNFEALANDGLPVVAFETTAQSKPPLIESLVLAFERQEIAVLNDPVLLGELGAFERKVSPATGRSQYSAPEGLHDDCVMSLALAWHGVIGGGTGQSVVISPPDVIDDYDQGGY